jgi:molybdate transport system regulatory protein
MKKKTNCLSIRSKIWVADGAGKVVFGLGRLKILAAIQRNGSILAASKELGMSYRAVWGRIKATEDRLGYPLLARNIGGKAGGGSKLTPFALELMERFGKLHRLVAEESDKLFDELMASRLEPIGKSDGFND